MVSDEITAWLITRTSIGLEWLLLASHVASLGLLFAAVWLLARRYAASRWTAAACCLAVTLRHRITETGANSFEGYYHPRGLAFACGAAAAAAVARDRQGVAWALVATSMVLHPTTGLWWAVWLTAATIALSSNWRRRLAEVTVVMGLLAGGLALTPLAARLRVMDEAWLRPLASKDYILPTEWAATPWLANLAMPAVVVAVWLWRRRQGLAARWEMGMVAGVVLLTGTFLLSLPFIALRVALAVQAQTSRVFWIIDLMAVVSVTWLLAEGRRRVTAAAPGGSWRPAAVALLLLVISASRGIYLMRVLHPERAFVQAALADTDWVRVGRWIATQSPIDSHVLADPGHDWKFGHSVRITARRDVLVEGVKDAAVSLYDRDVAVRVQSRLDAIGDFDELDARKAADLARRFDLDVLVIDRDLPLPELHRDGRFRVYRLQ